MTLDNMTGITEGSYTGFCKSQLITCNRVKECNGVCPFEDALKHAGKEMNEQIVIDHDRDWIIGCIEHDGFIKTDRFDKANQIILDALSAEARWIPCSEKLPKEDARYLVQMSYGIMKVLSWANVLEKVDDFDFYNKKHSGWYEYDSEWGYCEKNEVLAWMPLPEPWKGEENG